MDAADQLVLPTFTSINVVTQTHGQPAVFLNHWATHTLRVHVHIAKEHDIKVQKGISLCKQRLHREISFWTVAKD